MVDAASRGKDGSGLLAVSRAGELLDAFTHGAPHLPLSALVEVLGMSRATTHRYTRALREAGMLEYDSARKLYALGPRVLALASVVHQTIRVVDIAAPVLRDLGVVSGLTVVVSVWDAGAPVVVRCDSRPEHDVRLRIREGTRLHPARSAQGRVFQAYLPVTRTTLADAEVAAVLDTGVAVNDPAHSGVAALAGPVRDGRGIEAALAVVGMSTQVDQSPWGELADVVRSSSEEVSRLLVSQSVSRNE